MSITLDSIEYRGERFLILGSPLTAIVRRSFPPIRLARISSANRRGYEASWSIQSAHQLELVEFNSTASVYMTGKIELDGWYGRLVGESKDVPFGLRDRPGFVADRSGTLRGASQRRWGFVGEDAIVGIPMALTAGGSSVRALDLEEVGGGYSRSIDLDQVRWVDEGWTALDDLSTIWAQAQVASDDGRWRRLAMDGEHLSPHQRIPSGVPVAYIGEGNQLRTSLDEVELVTLGPPVPLTLDRIIGTDRLPCPADWYSGRLELVSADLSVSHGGRRSQPVLYLDLEEGRLIRERPA